MARYSDFWLIQRGRLELPGWKHKAYERAEPLPTPDELERFAQLPLEARRQIEASGYGYSISQADSQDKLRERKQRKRAA